MMPIFTKEISSTWPRLLALSRDSSICVVTMSLGHHVLPQPFRDRRLIVDVEYICLMGQSDNFLLIGIILQSP